MRYRSLFNGSIITWIVCICVAFSSLAALADDPPSKAFQVQLIDQDGTPVDGACAGLSAAFGNVTFENTGWELLINPSHEDLNSKYSAKGLVSDRNGVVAFAEGDEANDRFAIVAWHRERNLVAIGPGLGVSKGDPLQLTMVRACRVHGDLACLPSQGKSDDLRRVTVEIFAANRLVLEYWSIEPRFEFSLPAGKYELRAVSRYSGTHDAKYAVEVPEGQRELDVGTLGLPLTKLRLLEGHAAPEFRDVVAWKNSEPLTLAELRGKVILLDFWGTWCAPCIAKLPKLFELHDKYHRRGLTIVGVHQDAGAGVDDAVTLDAALEGVRTRQWKGRDIPFPVCFLREQRSPLPLGASGTALNRFAADYGIAHPTMILIDRRGNVVGRFDAEPRQIEKLEKLLTQDQ